MVASRCGTGCDFCGAPYGTWVASLGMALCPECERAGAEHPAREPVLVGDVLAGLAEALVPYIPHVPEQRTGPYDGIADPAGPPAGRSS